MTFHTGIGRDRIEAGLQNLADAGLVVYDSGLLWVPRIPRDNTFMRLTYWRKLLLRDQEEYSAYPSTIPTSENRAYRAWRETYATYLAGHDQDHDGVQDTPARGTTKSAADVIPPWEQAADAPESYEEDISVPQPAAIRPDRPLPTPKKGVGTYQADTYLLPGPPDNKGPSPLPTYLYLSQSLSPPEEDLPIGSRGCGGASVLDQNATSRVDEGYPGATSQPDSPGGDDPAGRTLGMGSLDTAKRWRTVVAQALGGARTVRELQHWIATSLLRVVLAPRTWPDSDDSADEPPPTTIPFRPLDAHADADDWTPDGETLPHVLATASFIGEWARYLRWRWLTWHEWPDRATQSAQWQQLARWFDPIACVRQSIARSFKGIFPLREDLDGGRYTRSGTVLRASRRARSTARRGGCVTDTVIGYAPRLDPDTSSGSART